MLTASTSRTSPWVEAEDLHSVHSGRLPLQGMRPTVDKFERSSSQGVEGLLGEKDRVTSGLGELFDAGRDTDGVADQRELELAAAPDGAEDQTSRC